MRAAKEKWITTFNQGAIESSNQTVEVAGSWKCWKQADCLIDKVVILFVGCVLSRVSKCELIACYCYDILVCRFGTQLGLNE